MSEPIEKGMCDSHSPADPGRRSALRTGLGLGVALVLGGCGSASRRMSSLPSPLWPDDPLAGLNTEATPTATPTTARAIETQSNPLDTPRKVLARRTWTNARPIPGRMNRQSPIRQVTIHHDGMPPIFMRTKADVADRLVQIRRLHVDNRGWGDIGYHYIVDPHGRVWEGRPISWQGAHVANQNPGNVGVMCLGNFEVQSPTRAQVEALDAFVGAMSRRHSVSLSRIVTHQELAPTLCPGRSLQRHVDSARARGGQIASLAIA